MKLRIISCLSLMMIVGSVAVAQCNGGPNATASVNWPQFHFDPCKTGYNPYEFILGPATVGNLSLKWKTGSGGYSPAVANGVVYIGSDDFNVYALNANTGAPMWKYTTGNFPSDSVAVASGIVYAVSIDLYALNASTGTLLWKYPNVCGHLCGRFSPTVANGVVYIGSDALNAATGALIWSSNAGVYNSPAVANGVVYLAADYGEVYALNAGTGALLWRSQAGMYEFFASPAVINGVVYVGAGDGNVYAFGLPK